MTCLLEDDKREKERHNCTPFVNVCLCEGDLMTRGYHDMLLTLLEDGGRLNSQEA